MLQSPLRSQIFLALPILCAAILNSQAQTSLPIAVPPVESLAYAGTFDVPTQGLAIQDFWPDKTGLYFLLRAQGAAELLHTDNAGREVFRISVYQPGFTARELRSNTQGELAVLASQASSSKLLFYHASDGIFLHEQDLGQRTDHIAPQANGTFASYSERADALAWASSGPVTALSSNSKHDTFLLTGLNNSLSLIESTSGRVSRLQPGGVTQTFQLHGPEIDGVLRTQYTDPNVSSLIVIAAYADSTGRVWIATSPYWPKRGASILGFDDKGKPLKRFLCSLPVYDALRGRSNPGGQMELSFIAKQPRLLFIVSRLGAHCAFYHTTD